MFMFKSKINEQIGYLEVEITWINESTCKFLKLKCMRRSNVLITN